MGEEVAIVGMSCRAPGARDYRELWSLLLQGIVTVGPWPASRRRPSAAWSRDVLEMRHGFPRLDDAMSGGYLDDVAGFDADLFGISAREASAMDPQHRLLLEAAWSALQDGGIDPRSLPGYRPVPTGPVLRICDYGLIVHAAGIQTGPYAVLGGAAEEPGRKPDLARASTQRAEHEC